MGFESLKVPRVKDWLPPPRKHTQAGRLLPRAHCPHQPPELTRLTMATLRRLPIVRMARDKRSRGWVSTLSEMACNTPRAGQHLCGVVGSGGRANTGTRTPWSKCPADVGAPESSARDGPQSHCAPCPELRTHGVHRQKGRPHPQSLGTAAATWDHQQPKEGGITGRSTLQTVAWAGGAQRASGSGPSQGPPTHQELMGEAQAQHQRHHTGHQPEGQTENSPAGEQKTLVLGAICPGPRCRHAPQPPDPDPNCPAPGRLLPQPPSTHSKGAL